MRIIDAHNHIGDVSATGAVGASRSGQELPAGNGVERDIEHRLAILDGRGVAQTVIIAPHGYLRPDGITDTRRMNDAVALYRDQRPDRFPAAVGVVEPLYGERGFAELERCQAELGLRGISFHTRFQGVSTNSLWVRRYLERMADLGLVAFVHALGESPEEALWKVEAVASELPDLPFVVLDAFATFEQSMFVPTVAMRCPNLFFDTATSHGWGFVAPLVESCGASRLVYGSDLHSTSNGRSDLTDPLAEVQGSGLDQSDLEMILGGTIARILRLDAAWP